jgi:flagellar basal-body rod protein FlgG
MQSIYTAKMGLKTQQQRMDVVASNISNVSTNGYKRQTAVFRDALYTQMTDASDVASAANLKQGSGVMLSSTGRDFTTGTPVETGQPLDLYIDGDGFFTVRTSDGSVMYTRGGSFGLSDEADGKYITTADGSYLLDSAGNRIMLNGNPEDVSVSTTAQLMANGTAFANLQLVTFTNKDGLVLTGSGCYTATAASGDPKASGAGIKQGYIESSNVDISTEFTQLIRAQRTFSLAGKALNAWNDMESTTNNLRT